MITGKTVHRQDPKESQRGRRKAEAFRRLLRFMRSSCGTVAPSRRTPGDSKAKNCQMEAGGEFSAEIGSRHVGHLWDIPGWGGKVWKQELGKMVGATGFEPATSWS